MANDLLGGNDVAAAIGTVAHWMAPLSIATLHAKPASQGTAPADRLDPLRNSGRRGRLTVPIGAHPQKSAMSQDRPAASVKLHRLINSSIPPQCPHFDHHKPYNTNKKTD